MGITIEQQHAGAVRRLHRYMTHLQRAWRDIRNGGGYTSHMEFDAAAWAFTGVLTHSQEVRKLLAETAHAFENGILLAKWEAPKDDPKAVNFAVLGLEVLHMMLDAYYLFDMQEASQWDGTTVGYDCMQAIEAWDPPRGRAALLYLNKSEVREKVICAPEDCWLNAHALIERAVPWLEDTLKKMKVD